MADVVDTVGGRWVKGTSIVVPGLFPSTRYLAQVSVAGHRDPSGSAIKSAWSPTIYFDTITDDSAPAAPRDFAATLEGETFIVTWSAPTENEDGSSIESTKDFRDYVITFWPEGDPDRKEEYATTDTRFELPLPLNRLLFGQVAGSVVFEGRSRDMAGNVSETPAIAEAGMTPPEPPVLEVTEGPVAVTLSWNGDSEVQYYTIHRSTIPTVNIDDPLTFVSSYNGNPSNEKQTYVYIPPATGTFYYRVVAYNAFGLRAQSNVDSGSAQSPIDDRPVSTPNAPVVTGGVHSITVEHTLQRNSGGTLEESLSYFEVYASTTSGFSPSANTYLGRIPVNKGDNKASGRFIYVVNPSGTATTQPVYVRVRSANSADGLSAASPQAAANVKKADGDYIAALSIGDAHISDLSAAKLQSNTAIINDLKIQALLTVQNGGVVKSGNFNTNSAGWYIDSIGYAEFNNVKVRGTVQATAGYLDGLNVRGTITVGDGPQSGTITSSNFTTTNGWAINSDGSATFRNITARGTIEATAGYMQNLTVTGVVTVGSSATTSHHIKANNNNWVLYGNGNATFNGTLTIGANTTISGSLSVNSSLDLGDTLTVQTGGQIRSGTSNPRIIIDRSNLMRFYAPSGRYWKIGTTEDDNFLFNFMSSGSDTGLAILSSDVMMRWQYGGTTSAFTRIRHGSGWQTHTGNAGIFLNNSQSRIEMHSGDNTTDESYRAWYGFNTDCIFVMHSGSNRSIATSSEGRRFYRGYFKDRIYAPGGVVTTSDVNTKQDIEDSELGLDFVRNLRPVSFVNKRNDSGRRHFGFLAQQVKEAFSPITDDFGGYEDPKINNPDFDDIPDEQKVLHLNYMEFIAPITRAVQEVDATQQQLIELINQLQERVTELEARVA